MSNDPARSQRAAMVAVLAATAMVGWPFHGVAASAAAPASSLAMSVQPTIATSGTTIQVRSQDPCPPPAGQSATVEVDDGLFQGGAQVAVTRAGTFAVGQDGSWSGSFKTQGTGEHSIMAQCIAGGATQAYATYAPAEIAVATTSVGYWLATTSAPFADPYGDALSWATQLQPPQPSRPIVAMAGNPATGLGYWLLGSDGGVFSAGDAGFYGSAAGLHLAAPAVGILPTLDGRGYWVLTADGGVFCFGDAGFRGSAVGVGSRTRRAVGIAPFRAPVDRGYTIAFSDGSTESFAADGVRASTPSIPGLVAPVVGIGATASAQGFWLAAADGGVFSQGDATYAGSLGGQRLATPIVGISSRRDGGYWLVGADGGVFTFGGAPFFGSAPGRGAHEQVAAIAATPDPLAGLVG
jgi:hypothetical protein